MISLSDIEWQTFELLQHHMKQKKKAFKKGTLTRGIKICHFDSEVGFPRAKSA